MADMPEKKDELITPSGEVLDQSVTGTLKIDPADHNKVAKNPSRLKSLKFGVAGLLYVLVREQSIRFASIVTVLVVAVGIWLHVNPYLWALLALALGNIWVTECLNTAIEAAINLGTQDPHPMAKVGKDVASAAALMSAIVFTVVVLLILLPRILERVGF